MPRILNWRCCILTLVPSERSCSRSRAAERRNLVTRSTDRCSGWLSIVMITLVQTSLVRFVVDRCRTNPQQSTTFDLFWAPSLYSTKVQSCHIACDAVNNCYVVPSNAVICVLAGGGFEEGRTESGRGEHESATLEVRGTTQSGTASGGADVAATSTAVTVPFASSEDDRNLQAVSKASLPSSAFCSFCHQCIIFEYNEYINPH